MSTDIMLVQDDVSVEPFSECCDDCNEPATHTIIVSFRSAGMGASAGHFCAECAAACAKAIRRGLKP